MDFQGMNAFLKTFSLLRISKQQYGNFILPVSSVRVWKRRLIIFNEVRHSNSIVCHMSMNQEKTARYFQELYTEDSS